MVIVRTIIALCGLTFPLSGLRRRAWRSDRYRRRSAAAGCYAAWPISKLRGDVVQWVKAVSDDLGANGSRLHSARMFASFATWEYFRSSPVTVAVNSSGEEPRTSTPNAANLS